jgi:hypothetical protein
MKPAYKLILAGMLLNLGSAATDSHGVPEILRISPTSGPEGTRVEASGRNLQEVAAVFFGDTSSNFKLISSDKLVVLVPHRAQTSAIAAVTPSARVSGPFPFVVLNDPRVPQEVSFKSGYVNSVPAPSGFASAMLWGIAIADTRVSGYESATVEIAWTQLSCRADGKDVVLNDDAGKVHGGLYRRNPWFGTNQNEPMPVIYDDRSHAVVLHVGRRADRVWHFWSGSPRARLPRGELEGCIVKTRIRISQGALLQMGMDYWRDATVGYGSGGNNHEAGVSNWYFPSERWQEAVFTDIGGPQF